MGKSLFVIDILAMLGFMWLMFNVAHAFLTAPEEDMEHKAFWLSHKIKQLLKRGEKK